MSDSEDFEARQHEPSFDTIEETKLINVKKYLQNPKQLMQKILFTSFKVDPFFPVQFLPIPQSMKPDTAQKDANNMNLIQQSVFRHQRLKKDFLGLMQNTNTGSKPLIKKTLPTITHYYENKTPIYQKYKSDQKSKCLATFILDSKTIIKQQMKKNLSVFTHTHSNSSVIATHRNKIQFNSNFQSGNLCRVYQIQYNEFDLVLQNDINTKGNNQWFFFLVKNVPKGLNLKFNIVNLSKKHSLFDMGMKPYVFSMIRYEKRKVGWVREGLKVVYDQNDKFVRENSEKPYYRLSFQYKFNFQGDVIYFSQSIPYRVTQLTSFIFKHIKQPRNSKLIKFRDLNRTLGNQQIDVLQITDQQVRQNKRIVWIIARQHPGQVTSSFMMQGIINYILSQNPVASQLLKRFIFKIVPMINIDGVIHGNSRAELSGFDPNRKWSNPHKIRNSIIWSLKRYIQKDKDNIQMFLDLHSHSRKLGTFFYGNSFRDNKISTRKYPWMVCKNDERFSYAQCRFSQCNINSARHVLFQSLQIPLIYTVESSFFGYQKNDHRIIQYIPKDYRQMGEVLIRTFWDYVYPKIQTSARNVNTLKIQDKKILQQMQQFEIDEKDSVGSDSDPGQDQFSQKQLKKLLPNFYGMKKTKDSKTSRKPSKKQKPKKTQKQQAVQPAPKVKKNDNGRNSCMQKKTTKQKLLVQTRQYGTQVCIAQKSILKGCSNITASVLSEKKSSLCIWGQKMQQEITTNLNSVGLQVDMMKVFSQSRQQARKSLTRKSFKLSSRPNSILQVKENNFLNRADCHTLPLRSLSRR